MKARCFMSRQERREQWARRLPAIREARANGESYETIGDRYGVTRYAIYLLCKAHGIRGAQRKEHARVQAITDAKRRYWHGAA